VRRVFALAIAISFASSMSAEKPFDFAVTPGKLPKQAVPTEYSVRIVPKIDKLSFSGTETVKLEVHTPVRELVLNALSRLKSQARQSTKKRCRKRRSRSTTKMNC